MGAADDEAELRTTIDIEAHGSGERGYTGIEGTQASGCWGGDAEANAIANGSSSASSPKVRRSHQFANRESACILVVLAVMFSLLFVCGMYHIHGAALATGGAGGEALSITPPKRWSKATLREQSGEKNTKKS
eukprot:g8622.t1